MMIKALVKFPYYFSGCLLASIGVIVGPYADHVVLATTMAVLCFTGIGMMIYEVIRIGE